MNQSQFLIGLDIHMVLKMLYKSDTPKSVYKQFVLLDNFLEHKLELFPTTPTTTKVSMTGLKEISK